MPEPLPPTTAAAIALGSNLSSTFGDRSANLSEALRRVQALGRLTAVSSFHDTDPVGYRNQPRFLNAAALIETRLSPQQLLAGLLSIELAMGRDRAASPPKGPRVIDLDLLFYGDEIITTPDLTLPHPSLHEREFVLAPLAEIAPTLEHPTLRRCIEDLLAEFPAAISAH